MTKRIVISFVYGLIFYSLAIAQQQSLGVPALPSPASILTHPESGPSGRPSVGEQNQGIQPRGYTAPYVAPEAENYGSGGSYGGDNYAPTDSWTFVDELPPEEAAPNNDTQQAGNESEKGKSVAEKTNPSTVEGAKSQASASPKVAESKPSIPTSGTARAPASSPTSLNKSAPGVKK